MGCHPVAVITLHVFPNIIYSAQVYDSNPLRRQIHAV
jgi:hypothetical protein